MNIRLVLSMIAAAVLVSACGGGNSADDFASGTTPIVNPTTPTVNTLIVGNKVIRLNSSFTSPIARSDDTSDLNKVVVGGLEMDFFPPHSTKNTIYLHDHIASRVGTRLAYMQYGYAKSGLFEPVLFAQGQLTTNMPSTGSATYRGGAVQIDGANTPIVGSAVFDVNYANRTVLGTVEHQGRAPIQLQGVINGRQFGGTTPQGFRTQGYFYGSDASELGGVYRNATGTMSGAYGASR